MPQIFRVNWLQMNVQDLIDCKSMLIQEMSCVVKQQVIVWTNVDQAK